MENKENTDLNVQKNEEKPKDVEGLIMSRYLFLQLYVYQSRLEKFYNEYHLSEFQRFAVAKFIKENIGNI